MLSQLAFRPAEERDTRAVSGLVRDTFFPATLPGWTAAAVTGMFNDNSPEALSARFENTAFAQVCVRDGSIIGYINCKLPRLISLLAVNPSAQRSGIGSRLLALALEHIAVTASDVSVVEVNATEYSIPFYRRHAFYPISELIEFEGCRFVRMGFWRKNPVLSNA